MELLLYYCHCTGKNKIKIWRKFHRDKIKRTDTIAGHFFFLCLPLYLENIKNYLLISLREMVQD